MKLILIAEDLGPGGRKSERKSERKKEGEAGEEATINQVCHKKRISTQKQALKRLLSPQSPFI